MHNLNENLMQQLKDERDAAKAELERQVRVMNEAATFATACMQQIISERDKYHDALETIESLWMDEDADEKALSMTNIATEALKTTNQ